MIHLASSPPQQVPQVRKSVLDLFRSKTLSPPAPLPTQHIMHRPLSAPVPHPETHLGPDGTTHHKRPSDVSQDHIAVDDWDQLFRAVQTRLENCVGAALLRTPQLALQDRHAVIKAAVLDCVNDLRCLHASLTMERQKWLEHQKHQEFQALEQQQKSSRRVEH